MNCHSKLLVALGLLVVLTTVSHPTQALPIPPPIETPTRADLLFRRGLDKFLEGNYAGAIADYNLALQINPRRVDILIARGEARRRLGDLQGAIADSTRAIQLDAQSVDAWTNRCAARYTRGDLQGAIADCSQSLTLDPTDADAFYNRALAYQKQGKIREALNDFQQAAELYQQQLDIREEPRPPVEEVESDPEEPIPQPSLSVPAGGEGEVEPAPTAQPELLRSAPVRGRFAQPRGRGIPGRREAAGSR